MDQNTCKIKTVTSTLKEIKNGVPQGSVLGPLLFFMFINELPRVIQNAEVVLFADDTSILIMENNPLLLNEKVQTVRKQLENWFYENRLIINTEKSKVINTISSFRPLFCINNKEVVRSVDVTFLGIFLLKI
jgi:retron-type reverse transcriptase